MYFARGPCDLVFSLPVLSCTESLPRIYLVPLSDAIMVLVQSLPGGHVVLAVEAGEVDPEGRG